MVDTGKTVGLACELEFDFQCGSFQTTADQTPNKNMCVWARVRVGMCACPSTYQTLSGHEMFQGPNVWYEVRTHNQKRTTE